MASNGKVKAFIQMKSGKVAERTCPFCLGTRKFIGEKTVKIEGFSGPVDKVVDVYICGECRRRSWMFAE